MGRIARVLSFLRTVKNAANATDVKADPGGGPPVTAEHFACPGDDAHPMPGDSAALVRTSGEGRQNAVGYADTLNTAKAEQGEKRIYARNPDGVPVVELWLKNTGEAVLSNDNGSATLAPDGATRCEVPGGFLELEPDGTVNINGVTIAPSGAMSINGVEISASGTVTIPASLTLAGLEIAFHTHPITGGSSSPGPTGPNT